MNTKGSLHLSSEKGFSLIEVVIACVFVALIGIALSTAFLKTTQVSMLNRESKRAAALADMVFERYVVYASSSFVNLNTYVYSAVSPATFFGTPDNLGYDN